MSDFGSKGGLYILGNFRMTLGTLLEHPFHFKGAFGKKMSHKKFEALKMMFFAP